MKTWLITGCSSDLGRGIAKAVLRRGDWAAVTARDPAELNTLAQAYPDRGGSFVELYYIRDADMNLAKIPDGVTLEQAVMVPDMMCTAFEGVQALNMRFGQ